KIKEKQPDWIDLTKNDEDVFEKLKNIGKNKNLKVEKIDDDVFEKLSSISQNKTSDTDDVFKKLKKIGKNEK
ncbi:MAG: hypothetical protein ACMXX8_01990, partial [Candidatus Woesearchaeota archaeon]